MLALNLLSEASHGPDLTWLLIVVLVVFALIVAIGWMTSGKQEDAPAESHAPAHADHVEAAVEEASAAPDDLTKLEGIGPKVSSVLTEAGYESYAKLAAANVDDLRSILKSAGLQMMEPAGWIEQAELAAKGDMEALEKLQDVLKGGRRV